MSTRFRVQHAARRVRRALGPAVLISIAACQSTTEPGNGPPTLITALPRTLSASEQAMIAASNRFAPTLLAQVNATRTRENVFLSPLSASMALGMTLNGASGTTFDEMRAALGLGTMPRESIIAGYRDLLGLLRGLDAKVDFQIANAIWYERTFGPAIAPTFLSEATQFFGATTTGLDFTQPSAVSTINEWVKTRTSGKITSIVDNLPGNLVMLLANAIYFKGDWREAFDKAKTASAPFTTDVGRVVNVPTMRRTGTMRAALVDGRQVVDLGYGGDAFSMTVMLPRDGESVNTMVASLTESMWTSAVSALAVGEVELSMPRFTMAWEATLNDPLKAMGMRAAFVAGGADFSRLAPTMGRDLYISFVKQKTFVDVNEVGTEAAAVTAVGVVVTSLPVRRTVKIDRPFVFAIRERLTGTIVFMGKVVDPPTS